MDNINEIFKFGGLHNAAFLSMPYTTRTCGKNLQHWLSF